ncbi:DUF6653 family protein [Falsiroseomonas oryziterrae]|uniref:DUF6653 family protein n=1 Tax=Falsiroseomonas oryziterrae TaxID=2911368 RepID=UPI001F209AC1|nr:DUF6653 family protein [Roseomonas sp. NPKOSM-4]
MTIEARIARLHRMDDAAWARHANPWSVWTRVPILPLLALAIWSRVWIGWWALLPVVLLVGWTWINPRVFPPPPSLDNWGSRAVLGERLWLMRDQVPVPPRHRRLPTMLNAVAGAGGAVLVGGLAWLSPTAALTGFATAFLAKIWFLDRMNWLVADMAEDPRLLSWGYRAAQGGPPPIRQD